MTERIETFAIVAGQHPSGEPVIEQLEGTPTGEERCYVLTKSPMFVKGTAAGDKIQLLNDPPGTFRVLSRSGILALRVFCKDDMEWLKQNLIPELEKLDATFDLESPRALVFSVHFSIGFSAIEEVMERWTDGEVILWQYGNVYDTKDGTPLNWWNDSEFQA